MKINIKYSLLVCMMVVSTIIGSITLATPALASPATDAPGPEEARAFLYYKALAGCFKNGGDPRISTASLAAGNWFLKNTSTGVGVILNSTDGRADCRDSGMVKAGLTALGYSDYRKAWCDTMKYANVTSDCAVAGEAYASGDRESSFKQSVEETYWGSRGDPTSKLSAQARYYLYYNTFMTGCKPKQLALYSEATDDQKTIANGDNGYIISVIDNTTKKATDIIYEATVQDQTYTGPDGEVTTGGIDKGTNILTYDGFTPTCGELAQWTNDAAQGIDPSHKPAGPITGGDGTSDKPSCAVEGIGWIVCPVLNFVGKLNDAAFSFIASLLNTSPDVFTNDGTLKAWGAFRDVANILFVIAFMIIVYSQITGAGISNYGLKKMLPKLIIAAILVNSSYLLCQLAVDITNILGYTLNSFIGDSIFKGTGVDTKWVDATGNILAGAAAVGAVIALVVLCFTAPIVLLVLAITLLALVIRQVLIILLIVVAPVAFVAYLLPNTEQFFKKWWKMFSTLLMLFPIIAVLFGASKLAASVIQSVGASQGGVQGTVFQIIALVAAAIPLAAAPSLLKGALAAAGAVGAKVAGLQNKANARAGNSIKNGRLGEAKAAFDARRRNARVNRRLGNGRIASWGRSRVDKGKRGGKALQFLGSRGAAFDRTAAGQYAGGSRGAASAVAEQHKAFDEEVSRQKALVSGRTNEDLLKDLQAGKGSEEYQAAVAGTIVSRKHRESQLQALDIIGKRARSAEASGNAQEAGAVSSIQKQMAHDMKEKPFALGDQAAGQLETGDYGKSFVDGKGNVQQFGDINRELRERVGTKLSPSSLANMNPDELKRIHAMAMSGELSEAELDSFKGAIGEIRKNKQMEALVKPEAKALHDAVLSISRSQDQAAATYGTGI